MSDQGILSVQPSIAAGAPPPAAAPPPPAVEPGEFDSGGDEDALLAQALQTLDSGEEQGDEIPDTEPQPKPKEPAKEEQTQAKLSKGFAKLAEQEDRLDRRYKAWQSEQAQATTELQAARAEVATYKAAMEQAKQSPLSALKALGWEYDQLAQYVLKDGQLPPAMMAKHLEEHQKSEYSKLEAQVQEMRRQAERANLERQGREYEGRVESEVQGLFADGSEAATQYPNFAHHFKNGRGVDLMIDVKRVLAQHFNETCVRDPKTGRIIKPGEVVASERAVRYVESILAKMQVGQLPAAGRNPGQPGAAQAANAGAAKPRPLVPRDYSEAGIPSEQELEAMTDEQREALAMQMFRG